MKKIIGFFSSDARDLYESDIFRILAYPDDYVIQFRYSKTHISEDILDKLNNLIGKEAVIFFTKGNNLEVEIEHRKITNYSIRKAIIVDIVDDENGTGRVYFYLQLKNFVDYDIKKQKYYIKKYPPYKFVTELVVEESFNNKWIDKVDLVKEHFNECLFLKINRLINKEGLLLKPKYDKNIKEAYYIIDEEEEYYIEMLFYDLSEGKNKFNIETENTDIISINKLGKNSIGAVKDRRNISFTTHTLNVNKLASCLNIYSKNEDNTYDIQLKVYVQRKKDKPHEFGRLSAIAAAGILFGQLGMWVLDFQQFDYLKILFALVLIFIGLTAIYYSSSKLFSLFNKK